MRTIVVNARIVLAHPNTMLIDRTTQWGNPFAISKTRSREDVIEQFKHWLYAKDFVPDSAIEANLTARFRWMRNHIHQLEGKYLRCWCKPDACHGDILVQYLNEQNGEDCHE